MIFFYKPTTLLRGIIIGWCHNSYSSIPLLIPVTQMTEPVFFISDSSSFQLRLSWLVGLGSPGSWLLRSYHESFLYKVVVC